MGVYCKYHSNVNTRHTRANVASNERTCLFDLGAPGHTSLCLLLVCVGVTVMVTFETVGVEWEVACLWAAGILVYTGVGVGVVLFFVGPQTSPYIL
jgi:hypothetical protein